MGVFVSNSLVELELYTDEAIRHICFLAQNGRIAMGCSIYTTSHDKSTNQNYLNSVELAEQFRVADDKEAKLFIVENYLEAVGMMTSLVR